MAQYPKPSNNYPTFSQGTFTNPTTGGLTIDEGKKYFLTFPTQQANTTETMSTVLVQGTLGVAQTATFNNTVSTAIHSIGDVLLDDALNVGGITTLEGDLDITDSNIILNGTYLTNYIEFPDGSKQYSADAGISPYTVLNNQDNTYVAGFNQTFVGDINSVGVNGPIVFTNTTSTGGTGSLYVDPNSGNDITIYSAQSTNSGLTVRNSTNSFTVNPSTVNGVNNIANFINPINSNSNISTQNQLVIYDGSTFTNNTTIDQQATNLVFSNNSSPGAIVFNQVGATNPQILVIGNNGAILQDALYIRSSSNQALQTLITQGANLTIFNACASGLNSNIVFQLNNPVSGQPAVQPLIIYSASCNFNVPIYAYNGITLSSGGSTTSILEYNDNTIIRNNNIGGNIQLVTTGTGSVTTNVLNLNSTTQTRHRNTR